MNTDDLRDVVVRLDALESLTKLFKNLWFDHIKGEIHDEKIKAYLMVFDDAFPGVDHVIEFMRKNAKAISKGEKVQEDFEVFSQTLLKREIERDLDFKEDFDPELFEEESIEDEEIEEEDLTEAEREALETIGQGGDIDALFVEESSSEAEDASNEEIEAFLSADADAALEDEEELLDVEDEAEADDVDLEDLLREEEEEGEESEGMSASISEEEMAALLGDDEEEPPPKAKAKKKPAEPGELEIDDAGNREESVSQDEIDALFG